MDNYQIVYDIWEGNPTIDIGILKENSIAGFILRLNSMSGGHHMDEQFWANYKKLQNDFLTMLYFVYNPWVDDKANYTWLKDHFPGDITLKFCADIEVKYAEYNPDKYADAVEGFIKRVQDGGYDPMAYTGGWFLNCLSRWPKIDYHWARYPYSIDRNPGKTFDELRSRIASLKWEPDAGTKAPGPVKLWQISDKWILPGTPDHAIDVNLFNGTYDELKAWWGNPKEIISEEGEVEEPCEEGFHPLQFRTKSAMNVRSIPSVAPYSIIGQYPENTIFPADDVAGLDVWIKSGDGYICHTRAGKTYLERVD